MLAENAVTRALWKASHDRDFRNRARQNLGYALAQDGFILSDAEMAYLRDWWESLHGLSDRGAQEQITAQARRTTGKIF